MAVISIQSKEKANKIKYIGVKLKSDIVGDKLFDSGDFIRDWFALNRFIYFESELNTKEPIAYSSSVDHFIMDTNDYSSMYLKFSNGEPILIKEYDENYLECFVKAGEDITWDEYKKYCKK